MWELVIDQDSDVAVRQEMYCFSNLRLINDVRY